MMVVWSKRLQVAYTLSVKRLYINIPKFHIKKESCIYKPRHLNGGGAFFRLCCFVFMWSDAQHTVSYVSYLFYLNKQFYHNHSHASFFPVSTLFILYKNIVNIHSNLWKTFKTSQVCLYYFFFKGQHFTILADMYKCWPINK